MATAPQTARAQTSKRRKTRETDIEWLIADHRAALALVIEIHEKLGYLPTWTRTAGEIADWYRKASEFLGPRAILDLVKKRYGKTEEG